MNQIILSTDDIFVEGIRVISKPLDTDMGVKPLTPFVLSVSAETSNYEELVVDLYANNSKAIPYTSELDNNWSALKAQWRFLDIDGNIIEEKVSIDFDTEVVDLSGNIIGGVGTASFYYVDDLPSDCGVPVMLECVLNTLNYYAKDLKSKNTSLISSYNSTMKIIIPFTVYPIKPTFLHFSQNGGIDIYDTQWVGNNIHSYVTINGVPRSRFLDYTQCAVDYPIIFNSPASASDGTTNILDFTIAPLLNSEMSPSASPSAEFLPFKMASGIADGGWAELNSMGLVETSAAVLSGTVDITYDNANYECQGSISMWVSNSTANMIHKLESIYIDSSNPSLSAFYIAEGSNVNDNVYSTGFNVPFYDADYYTWPENANILSNVHELSGYSGVYGMAIDGDDNVWNVDFELDRIYKRDSVGGLIFTVDLQKQIPGALPAPYADSEYTWYGPSSISVDLIGDAYVTLYNSPYTIKISATGVLGAYFKPASAPTTAPAASTDEGTYYRPIDVETTYNGDVCVLYSNDLQSALVRFDSTGVELGSWDNSLISYRPTDMVYNYNGVDEIIYISMIGQPSTSATRGIAYTRWTGSSFNVPSKLALCDTPSFITLDIDKNIWFAYDNNRVGCLNSGTVSNSGSSFQSFEIPTTTPDLNVIGGLCCDASGFINTLQTYSNVMYRQASSTFISSGTPSLYGIKINPDENYTIVEDGGEIIKVPALSGEAVASLQAYGDWTGLSWDQKFGDGEIIPNPPDFETVTLVGSSTPFKIKSFRTDFDLRRFNDSWDMHFQIKSYVLPDFQQEFTALWDDLIGNVVGNDGSNYQTFGRQFYEKIANFVLNHSDVDLANVSQVYSLFASMALEYDNYDFEYPADLSHWMDILSIMFERLRGEQLQCNRNFKPARYQDIESCEVCGEIHPSNMGDKVLNPVMVEGEPVVIRDTFMSSDAFDIFYPPMSGEYQQLSDYYGFRTPFATNYEVFEYIPTVSANIQSEGLINWADSHNDIAISGIHADEWWEDGGYVEQIFTHILYGGLDIAVKYIPASEAQNTLTFNIIGDDLTVDNTTILSGGLMVSEYIIPVKSVGCSPIAGFGLPFYTTAAPVMGDEIEFGYPTDGIIAGLAVSDLYIEIVIGDETYYAPSYIIAPLVLPVSGNGITFRNGFVKPQYAVSSAGFLAFSNGGQTVLLPVYK